MHRREISPVLFLLLMELPKKTRGVMRMKINNEAEKLIQISDLALVTSLVSLGQFPKKADYTNRHRVVFFFVDSPKLQETINDFWLGKLTVEPSKYFATLKNIKARIYATIEGDRS